MDLNQVLIEIDSQLSGLLRKGSVAEVQGYVLELLTKASKFPGRTAKLHVTYIMERMAELVNDLKADVVQVRRNEEALLRWIDKGLLCAAYLVDPDSQGKWLESFDQTLVSANVPDMKDPAAVRQRQEEAAELQQKWSQTLATMPKPRVDPRSRASEPRRAGGDNLIILPR